MPFGLPNLNLQWRYGLLAQPGAQAIEPFLGTRARKFLGHRIGWLALMIV